MQLVCALCVFPALGIIVLGAIVGIQRLKKEW